MLLVPEARLGDNPRLLLRAFKQLVPVGTRCALILPGHAMTLLVTSIPVACSILGRRRQTCRQDAANMADGALHFHH